MSDMSGLDILFSPRSLLKAPVMRAAYSDRTAWLMSAMAELAYYQFEDKDLVSTLALELAQISNVDDIKSKLSEILTGNTGGGDIDTLKKILTVAGFELVNAYNRNETQGFLVKRNGDGNDPGMLVLAFRGTELVPKDIHSDADAVMVELNGAEEVHRGFLNAFKHVKGEIKRDLEEHSGIPVYITGHSLGGALAIIATRLLVSSSTGACYTFGSPRVGNHLVDDQIKTPIYRIINASDIVPRVPFAYITNGLIWVSRMFHLEPVAKFLRKFKGYVHYGDMRYLPYVAAGPDDTYPGLALHSNPTILYRGLQLAKRWIATMGKAAVQDHSISIYREKLRAYALVREKVGQITSIKENME